MRVLNDVPRRMAAALVVRVEEACDGEVSCRAGKITTCPNDGAVSVLVNNTLNR